MEHNPIEAASRPLQRSTPADSDVISAAQACAMLGVHRNTLYKLLETEELPAFRLTKGGRWRFRRSELQSWLQDKEATRRL
jgi:excisionase family DNA binding protein